MQAQTTNSSTHYFINYNYFGVALLTNCNTNTSRNCVIIGYILWSENDGVVCSSDKYIVILHWGSL